MIIIFLKCDNLINKKKIYLISSFILFLTLEYRKQRGDVNTDALGTREFIDIEQSQLIYYNKNKNVNTLLLL